MNKCEKCGNEVGNEYRLCPQCGSEIANAEENYSKSNKYPALKTVATLYKVFAIICAVVGVIIFVLSVVNGGSAILAGIPALIAGGFICLTGYAASEGIQVLIDIEENTRQK
jgi:hypothetical protein